MKLFIFLSLVFLHQISFAQDVSEQYLIFNDSLKTGGEKDVIALGEKLLPEIPKFSKAKQARFYYKMGFMHENIKEPEKALNYYLKSLEFEPNYYVIHMAIGYIYSDQANLLVPKINASKGNKPLYDRYIANYKSILRKSLPHFEKAMACDPNDQILQTIAKTYELLKDKTAMTSLNARLDELKKQCVDILIDD